MQKTILLFFISLSFYGNAQFNLPISLQEAIHSNTRDNNGQPGTKYWQNYGKYDIQVSLEPSTDKITGSEKITYFNNSPDTLKEIVLSILSDAYKKQSARDYNFKLEDMNDGVTITKAVVNGQKIQDKDMKELGTNQIISLSEYLLPNSSAEFEIDWSFSFPNIPIRCGNYEDSTFFVAYFYPRIAVYDDIDGWDKGSYTLMTEFYSDFNDYDVQITVPKDFVVWSTGELQNPDKVFTRKFVKRFEKANKSTEVVNIIKKEDVKNGNITVQRDKITYHYTAKNVPDFAFGTSDKFLWDASSVLVDKKTKRRSFVSAAYRQDSEDYYKIAALEAKIITNFSTKMPGVPYPYPAMTVFNGNSGMEFPMMCNDASSTDWTSSAGLAYHETAHTYFPFYMGTNERKHAWMDEGWASFFPMFFIDEEDPTKEYDYIVSRANRYYQFAGSDREIPIMTVSSDIKTRAPYRYTSYNKSYFAYYYLYRMLGENEFKKCLSGYMERWHGKHPSPYDFFNSFTSIASQDLSFFWENWFFDRNYADLAIEIEGNKITVKNLGGLFVPIHIEIILDDGSTGTIDKEADIWKGKECNGQIVFTAENKVIKAVLGTDYILDVNSLNNVYEE